MVRRESVGYRQIISSLARPKLSSRLVAGARMILGGIEMIRVVTNSRRSMPAIMASGDGSRLSQVPLRLSTALSNFQWQSRRGAVRWQSAILRHF
ncbi:hypothetical protein AA309_31125 [Microvirga vignae]|uniref:Uncharacterized protein n=1 Tax=Microvirga vignae TaxID=1225564 RepID=A0A0H1R390_9HYPH|nr:hypothetical protein AA309_31125 [Microvirga vignae]